MSLRELHITPSSSPEQTAAASAHVRQENALRSRAGSGRLVKRKPIAALVLALALAACNGGDDGGGSAPTPQPQPPVNSGTDGGGSAPTPQPQPPVNSGTDGGGSAPTPQPQPPVNSGTFGSYHLQSFAPLEEMVETLRKSLPYKFQKFIWQNRDGGSLNNSFYSHFALDSSRAIYAHAAGLTGADQTISIVDSGFRLDHETLAGKLIETGTMTAAEIVGDESDSYSHGTAVASVAAGDSSKMIGIAPDADLSLGFFDDDDTLADATERALREGAVAQNNSWGHPSSINATPEDFMQIFGHAHDAVHPINPYLAALDAYAAYGVVVFAVSNTRGIPKATLMEALPVLRPDLEAGWLAVGSAVPTFYTKNKIYTAEIISAGCLDAAPWCLVADGRWDMAHAAPFHIITSDGADCQGGPFSYCVRHGSSFAAPQVSGALALLAQAFPKLTPHQLRLRLLASADNGFFDHDDVMVLTDGVSPGVLHGYNDVYGHGFLNIRDALLPIGVTAMRAANGVMVDVGQPVILTAPALGDAVYQSLAGLGVAISDSLGAHFTMPGPALTAGASPDPLAPDMLARALTTDLERARLAPAGEAPSDPFIAFDGQTMGFASPGSDLHVSFLVPDDRGFESSYGVSLIRNLVSDGPLRIAAGLKFAHDGGNMIGFADANGDGLGADLAALHLGVSGDFDNGAFVALAFEAGIANLDAPPLVSNVSAVGFNTVGLSAGKRAVLEGDDRLTFGVSMPMAVTSGRATVLLPTSNSHGAAPTLTPVALDLSPGERQVDFSIAWQRLLAKNMEMKLELVHAANHGNIAGARDTAGILAIRYRF